MLTNTCVLVEINKHWLNMFILAWEQYHSFFAISFWITDRIAWFVCCCCCKTVTIAWWFCCFALVFLDLALVVVIPAQTWPSLDKFNWRFGASTSPLALGFLVAFIATLCWLALFRFAVSLWSFLPYVLFCLISYLLLTFLTAHHQLCLGSLLSRPVLQVKHLFQKLCRPRIFHLQFLLDASWLCTSSGEEPIGLLLPSYIWDENWVSSLHLTFLRAIPTILPWQHFFLSLTRISRSKSTSWSSVYSIVSSKSKIRQFGYFSDDQEKSKPYKDVHKKFSVWMSSKDSIVKLTLAFHQRPAPTSFAQSWKKYKYLCFLSMSEYTICTTWEKILL